MILVLEPATDLVPELAGANPSTTYLHCDILYRLIRTAVYRYIVTLLICNSKCEAFVAHWMRQSLNWVYHFLKSEKFLCPAKGQWSSQVFQHMLFLNLIFLYGLT